LKKTEKSCQGIEKQEKNILPKTGKKALKPSRQTFRFAISDKNGQICNSKKFFFFMRRVIRIKAMQGLYTYFNNKEVNLLDIRQKTYDSLIDYPEFFNAAVSEKQGFQMLLPLLLNDAFDGKLNPEDLAENQKWLGILARKAVVDWKNECKAEMDRIQKKATADIRNQSKTEVSFWQLFYGIIQMVSAGEAMKQDKFLDNAPSPAHELKILEHLWMKTLHDALMPEKGPKPQALKTFDQDLMHRLFQYLIKDLPEYQEYKSRKETSERDEEDIFRVLYRKLFKAPDFNEAMTETDLHWSENRILLEVALKTTFKKLSSGEVPDFENDAENEDEYISFFNLLFLKGIENFEEHENLLHKVVTNWDADRIAVLDRWIIHLSINEMKYFPHIPLKVTMNEYLEIAKAYSTPNSAGFINGVVDKMASILKEQGALKKSARGLMDNQ
jgi:N utilization substance protein B